MLSSLLCFVFRCSFSQSWTRLHDNDRDHNGCPGHHRNSMRPELRCSSLSNVRHSICDRPHWKQRLPQLLPQQRAPAPFPSSPWVGRLPHMPKEKSSSAALRLPLPLQLSFSFSHHSLSLYSTLRCVFCYHAQDITRTITKPSHPALPFPPLFSFSFWRKIFLDCFMLIYLCNFYSE